MIIDSLTSTDVYVERKIKIDITCDSNKNSLGTLEEDDLGNNLISIIDSGDTYLYRLKEYNGKDGVLFYNEETSQMKLVKRGELIDLRIDFSKGTKYYVGAKRLFLNEHEDYVFKCNLGELNIFKVFLDNGREIHSYFHDNDGIHITGADRLYIDDFTELVVYVYLSNSSSMFLGRDGKQDNSFVIEYYGYDSIINLDTFIDGSYFNNFHGMEIMCFEDMEITQNLTRDVTKESFSNSNNVRINSVENTVELNVFSASENMDLVQYLGTSEFRIILVNASYGRIVLVNNCKINNGVSLIYNKEKNIKKIGINCGNYIDINLSNPSLYGKGLYNRGVYSTGVQIYNSNRRGEI